jgi:hypothetical protein
MNISHLFARLSIKLLIVAVCCFALSACGLFRGIDNANLPTQYVIASIDGDRSQDARVTVHRSAANNLQTWAASDLFTCSGQGCTTQDTAHIVQPSTTSLGTITNGRGGSSPGIASTGDFYVIAFWGRTTLDPIDSTVVSMFVSVSHDGVAWTPPQPIHSSSNVHSNSQGIIPAAGISVAPAGQNGPWFASYADDTGAITIVSLPITSDGIVNTTLSSPSPVMVSGATTDIAPALSYLGRSLVLAWRLPGPSGEVRILTTTNGSAWPNASTASVVMLADGTATPAPISIQAGAPYMHASGSALFLTAPSGATQGASNVNLFSSTDGLNFAPVVDFTVLSPFFGGAAAGPAPTQYVVVYPSGNTSETKVFTSARPERVITTNTGQRVTVAGGP